MTTIDTPPLSRPAPTTHLGLVRGLGPWASTAIVVGTMVGTGIYLKPSEIAREAGSMDWALVAWVAGALLTLIGALCYLELGTMMPEAGADYAYLSRGLGPVWGFLYGWKGSVVSGPASTAALGSGIVLFASYFLPVLNAPLGHLGAVQVSFGQVAAVSVILSFCAINLLSVGTVGRIQVLLTAFKVISVVGVILAALVWSPRTGALHQPGAWGAPLGPLPGFVGAVTASLWTYSGWHTLLRVGSEVRDPGRTMPRAVIGGFIVTAGLFLLVNVACFSVLGLDEIIASPHPVTDMLDRTIGGAAAGVMTIVMIVSAVGSLNASMLGSARVPYAMARDGMFPSGFSFVVPATGAPRTAVLYPSLAASALVLTGSFADLTALFVFTQWLFFGLGTIALFRLRAREPHRPRPYRVWGYPVLPAVFLALTVVLTVGIVVERPVRSLVGLGLLLTGLPLYLYYQRRKPVLRG